MARIHVVLALAIATLGCARGGGGTSDATADTSKPIDSSVDSNGCSMQPCSILPQCGCTNGAQACDIDLTDGMGTTCRAVNQPGTETSTCNSADKCDKGYVCLGSAMNATCKKYCTTDADCGTPRGRCAIDISSNGMVVQGIPSACTSNCNPLPVSPPSECPTGYKCGLFTATHYGSTVKVADCTRSGTGVQGTNCKSGTNGNEALCGPGYLCTTVDGGTNYNCRRICNKTANTGCPGTTTCLAFATPHTIDIEYGVCN